MIRRSALALATLSAFLVLQAQDAGVVEIELKPSTNITAPLSYAKSEFTCKAGAKVKLTMNNNGGVVPQPHNVVLCKVGADAKVLAASMTMLSDPKGKDKSYVPESPDIIAFVPLAEPPAGDKPGEIKSVEFTAPMDPGDYPFFCTFPGHATMMKGILKVTQ